MDCVHYWSLKHDGIVECYKCRETHSVETAISKLNFAEKIMGELFKYLDFFKAIQ